MPKAAPSGLRDSGREASIEGQLPPTVAIVTRRQRLDGACTRVRRGHPPEVSDRFWGLPTHLGRAFTTGAKPHKGLGLASLGREILLKVKVTAEVGEYCPHIQGNIAPEPEEYCPASNLYGRIFY